MVSYSQILANNNALPTQDLTAVFLGATQGIGLGTVRALAKHNEKPTIWLFGRSQGRLDDISAGLKEINPNAAVYTIAAGDMALLANVKKGLEKMKSHPSAPKKIDLLILSAGYLSAAGRTPTAEALDHLTSIRFYARMLFTTELLSLIRLSASPRVITVLAGGQEGKLWPDDFLLESHYSFVNAAGAAGSMNTLFMESLAAKPENAKVTFIHLFPGIVTDTQNLQQAEHWGWPMRMLLGWVVLPIMSLFGRKSVEAGERVLYAGTTKDFDRGTKTLGSDGSEGSGVYLVQGDSSVIKAAAVAETYRKDGTREKLEGHTMEVFASVS